MALRRERVSLGLDEDGHPIIKWASGHSIQELHDNIVRTYIKYGQLERLLPEFGLSIIGQDNKNMDFTRFSEYALTWIGRYKESSIRDTTLIGYKSYLKKHLIPVFGPLALWEISVNEIQDFMNERAHLARKTLRELINLLKQILDSAIEDELISTNPAKSKRLTNPSDKVSVREALPVHQVVTIINALANLPLEHKRFMSLLLFTGLRRGEVLGLQWSDIDFEGKTISVQRNATYAKNQPKIRGTKTINGIRTVPLDPLLVDLLEPPQTHSGYIVGGTAPISLTSYRWMFKMIKESIDLHGATAHVFRHSYLTMLDEAGVDSKTLQGIAGHGDIKITMNRYVHGRKKATLEAGSKFTSLLQQNMISHDHAI